MTHRARECRVNRGRAQVASISRANAARCGSRFKRVPSPFSFAVTRRRNAISASGNLVSRTSARLALASASRRSTEIGIDTSAVGIASIVFFKFRFVIRCRRRNAVLRQLTFLFPPREIKKESLNTILAVRVLGRLRARETGRTVGYAAISAKSTGTGVDDARARHDRLIRVRSFLQLIVSNG